MKDKTINRILMGMAVVAALVLYGLTAHMDYVEARTGKSCETDVRSCE